MREIARLSFKKTPSPASERGHEGDENPLSRLRERAGERVISLLFITLQLLPLSIASATTWKNTWHTKNSQGMALYQKHQYKEAANTFSNKAWQATAAYRAGNFVKAAELYQNQPEQTALYNLGNTLAHLKQYAEAIHAYEKAIAFNPKDKDAIYNKALVEKLLKKEKQQPPPPQPQSEQNQNAKSDSSSQPKSDAQSKEQRQPQQSKKDKPENKSQPESKPGDQSPAIPNQQAPTNPAQAEKNEQQKESEQAKSQWLKLVPEHPGGLLRQQFLRDHLRRMRGESS